MMKRQLLVIGDPGRWQALQADLQAYADELTYSAHQPGKGEALVKHRVKRIIARHGFELPLGDVLRVEYDPLPWPDLRVWSEPAT